MHELQCFGAAIALATGLILPLPAAAQTGAGLMDLRAVDPVEGGPMPGVLVYPTLAAGAPMQRGLNMIDAVLDAAPAPGPFPLVVISHGTGGWELGHHDSLTALARAGFVAAALQHPRDNYRDDSGFGTDLQSIGRAHHIVAFIDALLAHPKIGPLIDRNRIGMAGFSAGGYTTLLTIGGRPNFALREAYARAVPDDPLTLRACRRRSTPRAPARCRRRSAGPRRLHHGAGPRSCVRPSRACRRARAGAALPGGCRRGAAAPWNAERIRQFLPTPPEYSR